MNTQTSKGAYDISAMLMKQFSMNESPSPKNLFSSRFGSEDFHPFRTRDNTYVDKQNLSE